jgi:hypothetical protein
VLSDFNLIYEVRDNNNQNINWRLMGRFRHVLDTCELFEFELQNRRFTWSNEREVPTLVRLDRVFCNQQWDLLLTGFRLQALSSSLSDHCPLLLCQQLKPRTKDSFRFENFWPRVPGLREVVQQAWQKPVLGINPLNVLHYKLQNTTKSLKSWSKRLFGKAWLELHIAIEVIHHLDLAQETGQLSLDELQLRKDLKVRILGLTTIERSRWRQASRVIWLKEGDECTRFFHLKAKGCSRRNFIPCLKKGASEYVWSHEEEEVLFSHF